MRASSTPALRHDDIPELTHEWHVVAQSCPGPMLPHLNPGDPFAEVLRGEHKVDVMAFGPLVMQKNVFSGSQPCSQPRER